MGKDALVAFAVNEVRREIVADGADAELIDVADGIARVRYRSGNAEDCEDGMCVMPPSEVRELLLEMIRKRAPYVTDVRLEMGS
jgi:hypothetical protein